MANASASADDDATVTSICGQGHMLKFFCSNCIRFFCGECSTITHSRKGGLKDHDVEPIEDHLTIEGQKGADHIKVFTQLSEKAEAAAIAKDAIDENLCKTLSEFVAHVEQLIMSSELNRYALFLHALRRDNIIFLQRETSVIRSYDPEINPIGSLVSRLTMNKHLDEQIERIKKAVENAKVFRDPNIVEAIFKAAVALKEQSLNTVIYLNLKFE